MSTVTFPATPLLRDVASHEVAVRENWSDDWAVVPHLYASKIEWKLSPEMPSAELYWRFGEGKRPDSNAFATIDRLSRRRHWVRIRVDEGDELLEWYGILEVDQEVMHGTLAPEDPGGLTRPAGQQTLLCYGMEQLLNLHTVTDSMFYKEPPEPEEGEPAEPGTEERVPRGLTFNRDGRPNRSTAAGFTLFSELADDDDNAIWSTRSAVEYLLLYQTPRDHTGAWSINFEVAAGMEDLLPDWDAPVLATHGVTVRQLLNALLPRQRLLSYYLRVGADGETVELVPVLWTDAELEVDEEHALPANPNQRTLVFDADAGADASIRYSELDHYDQVRVTGRRRTSTFTAFVTQEDGPAGQLVKGWTDALQTEYDQGASTEPDYPTDDNDVEKRQRMNADARAADKLDAVYSRFVLRDDWDFLARKILPDGSPDLLKAVFPGEDENDPFPAYRRELFVLPSLPLLTHHDYSGNKIASESVVTTNRGPYEERTPIVVFPLPAEPPASSSEDPPVKYQLAEKWGAAADLEEDGDDVTRRFSIRVQVPREDAGLVLKVTGKPQYMIAKDEFTSVVENDPPEPAVSFYEARMTISLADDRYAEAFMPDPGGVAEVVRVLHIPAGETHRLDYVVPGTVVGVAKNGELIISEGGYVRDDREELGRIARMAYGFYGRDRAVLELTVHSWAAPADLWLGDMITGTGDPEADGDHERLVRTPLAEITLTIPAGTDTSPPGPITCRYMTAGVEFDPLSMPKPRRGDRSKREATAAARSARL